MCLYLRRYGSIPEDTRRHELNMVAHGIAECLLEKVTQQGRRQEATECVASGYIEDWFEPRMLLVAFFSSLTKVRR